MTKLLVVDDASFMRLSIKTMVEKYDFTVVAEAGNGVEALEKYKIYDPDIITMDITMPVMTGIEALKEIKKINPKAIIIMVSAMGQEGLVKEAVIHGASSFIVKPFKEQTLIEVLNKMKGRLGKEA